MRVALTLLVPAQWPLEIIGRQESARIHTCFVCSLGLYQACWDLDADFLRSYPLYTLQNWHSRVIWCLSVKSQKVPETDDVMIPQNPMMPPMEFVRHPLQRKGPTWTLQDPTDNPWTMLHCRARLTWSLRSGGIMVGRKRGRGEEEGEISLDCDNGHPMVLVPKEVPSKHQSIWWWYLWWCLNSERKTPPWSSSCCVWDQVRRLEKDIAWSCDGPSCKDLGEGSFPEKSR